MSQQKTLVLGLLVCDEPPPSLKERHGDYQMMFENLSGQKIIPFDICTNNYPTDLDSLDGLLISGSRFSVYDDIPWIRTLQSFVANIVKENRIPLVGICFGHQIIAQSLNNSVGKNEKGLELGYTEIMVSKLGYDYFDSKSLIRLNSFHRDYVTSVPEGFMILGGNDHSNIQIMSNEYNGGKVLSFQSHPEFTKEFITDLSSERFKNGLISKKDVDHVLNTNNLELDSALIAKKIVEHFRKCKK